MPGKPAYRIFNQQGKEVPCEKMVRRLEGADIIFFGELHDNPIARWLQRELAEDLHESGRKELVLGARCSRPITSC